MTADVILAVQGVDVFYGASKILFGVDLEVARGRTLALALEPSAVGILVVGSQQPADFVSMHRAVITPRLVL